MNFLTSSEKLWNRDKSGLKPFRHPERRFFWFERNPHRFREWTAYVEKGHHPKKAIIRRRPSSEKKAITCENSSANETTPSDAFFWFERKSSQVSRWICECSKYVNRGRSSLPARQIGLRIRVSRGQHSPPPCFQVGRKSWLGMLEKTRFSYYRVFLSSRGIGYCYIKGRYKNMWEFCALRKTSRKTYFFLGASNRRGIRERG
jgi:hypothetical protein